MRCSGEAYQHQCQGSARGIPHDYDLVPIDGNAFGGKQTGKGILAPAVCILGILLCTLIERGLRKETVICRGYDKSCGNEVADVVRRYHGACAHNKRTTMEQKS